MGLNTDWSKIKHFKKEEWRKDPDKVNPALVIFMDELRERLGNPIHIHVAYDDDGHVKGSKHYIKKGFDYSDAVDFSVSNVEPVEVYNTLVDLLSERGILQRAGIGFYPFWRNIGFHLDLFRRTNLGQWSEFVDGSSKKLIPIQMGFAFISKAGFFGTVEQNPNGTYTLKKGG